MSTDTATDARRPALVQAILLGGLVAVAAIYCIASLRFNFLLRRTVFSGLVSGLCVYIVMNYIVVPLSAAQGKPPGGWMIVNGLFAHLVLFGLPIALFAKRNLSGVTERSAAITGAPREETSRA